MTRPICYIAAPYADPSPTIRAWHVDRAVLLARLAMACGYSPVETHTSIAAGVYGDDSDPGQRARGMAATAAICRGVLATPGAVLWALKRDDGSVSDGTRAECVLAADVADYTAHTWAEWAIKVATKAPHLLPEWDRLAVRPDAVGEWGPLTDGSAVIGRLYGSGRVAAVNQSWAWFAYSAAGVKIAQGPETGALGRAAADAALRAAGVMP